MAENQGCLAFLATLFGGRTKVAGPLPYRLRDDFLSPGELTFFRVLSTAVRGQATILTKVNLADMFFVTHPNENHAYRNRIDRKHVDFLLCDAKTMRPLVGIELDDKSHQRPQRQERDRFVDQVFEVAGLPLVRVPLRSSYGVAELTSTLKPHLGGVADFVSEHEDAADQGVTDDVAAVPSLPTCPKCGVPMVVRTAGRGDNRGGQFYGCPNYPKCRETRAIDQASA